MTKPTDSELLTLDQAAARLGWLSGAEKPGAGGRTSRAAKLLAAVEARERELGRSILHRRRGPKRTTLRVTVLALQEYLPELFPGSRSRMSEERKFRQALRSVRKQIDDRCEPLEAEIAQVKREGEVTRGMVVEVAEALDAVTKSVRPRTAQGQNSRDAAAAALDEGRLAPRKQ